MPVKARARRRAPGRRLLQHDRGLGARLVGGADEAGRGALAGPLVAAAVLLEPEAVTVAARRALLRLDDSKRCTGATREALLPAVLAAARRAAVIVVDAETLDREGIHRANLRALARALESLEPPDDAVLVSDGFRLPLAREHRALIDADEKCAAVAAASILAKVTRDAIMRRMHKRFPAFGFDRNKGYGSAEHLAALAEHGPTPIHRLSFQGVGQTALPGFGVPVVVAPAVGADVGLP
jgi:ribonuclease HII